MFTITESYIPFFPSIVSSIRSDYVNGLPIKSGHAHEIASAFFGYKSYSAAKAEGLDKQIGIFLPSNRGKTPQFQFYIAPCVEVAEARIYKLLPNISDYQVEEIISRLNSFYDFECDKVNGFVSRISRQLAELYDKETSRFEHYVLVTDEDWIIANEIIFRDDFIPHSYCSMPWYECDVLPFSKPMSLGDNLHQFNVDIFANIISFLKPDFMRIF